jgi:dTDP-4-amino-4,6-dideoxygalactose transaminase
MGVRTIRLLVPSMPAPDEVFVWLRKIDGQYTNFGPLCRLLEEHLAELAEAPHAVAVANCTLGLQLALECMDLPAGSQVLVPSLTFPATALAIVRAGLTPLFADIDAATFALNAAIARQAVAANDIKAVLPVALHGHVHDPKEWDTFTAQTGVPVLIDAAGAIGHQKIGATTSAVFSLHATKPLSTGEGGFVATASADLADRVTRKSNFGFEGGSTHHVGTNAKMSEYHAAVGMAALSLWPEWRMQRQRLYNSYAASLERRELRSKVTLATRSSAASNISVRRHGGICKRDISQLNNAGIETRRWYWPPLHRHPAFATYPRVDDLAATEIVSDQLLGLPFHLKLSSDDISRVCENLCSLVERG